MGRSDIRRYLATGQYRRMAVPGIIYSIMVMTHMSAMKLTKVAYMVSVKRSSLLIGVLFGYLFFRERGLRERFLGAALMFAGFIMVVNAR